MGFGINPAPLVCWAIVGLIAGWLAGKVMRGSGCGVALDIVIGRVRAVLAARR